MEMEHFETAEHAHHADHGHAGLSGLGTRVAITIALLATFLGLCKIKSDNIAESMQKLQVDRLDQWNFYQARNIREEVARAALVQLHLAQTAAGPGAQTGYRDAIKTYDDLVADQEKKKEDVRKQAETDETDYEHLEYRHDQFSLCDAAMALAIAILAMTALTQRAWLFGVALAPAAAGVLMGLAGLCSWRIHPDVILRWLR